eukprot:677953-Amphidinium_carterae.1
MSCLLALIPFYCCLHVWRSIIITPPHPACHECPRATPSSQSSLLYTLYSSVGGAQSASRASCDSCHCLVFARCRTKHVLCVFALIVPYCCLCGDVCLFRYVVLLAAWLSMSLVSGHAIGAGQRVEL